MAVRGQYYPNNKEVAPGDRKLFLQLESLTERGLQLAKAEVARLIKEEMMKMVSSFKETTLDLYLFLLLAKSCFTTGQSWSIQSGLIFSLSDMISFPFSSSFVYMNINISNYCSLGCVPTMMMLIKEISITGCSFSFLFFSISRLNKSFIIVTNLFFFGDFCD